MTFVDIRDRYGITQVVSTTRLTQLSAKKPTISDASSCELQITGKVAERYAKNPEMPTGDIEIEAQTHRAQPFGSATVHHRGRERRAAMTYAQIRRYLDLRRPAARQHRVAPPYGHGGTPLSRQQGIPRNRNPNARRLHSRRRTRLCGPLAHESRPVLCPAPVAQTLKQLLMVSGYGPLLPDSEMCFRDEDLRADRQPEFTQIDREMSFVNQDDIIQPVSRVWPSHLFKELRGVELTEPFIRMPWADAMRLYSSDKPDLRFGMTFVELMDVLKGTRIPACLTTQHTSEASAPPALPSYTRK